MINYVSIIDVNFLSEFGVLLAADRQYRAPLWGP
jgi:hypothetical protein